MKPNLTIIQGSRETAPGWPWLDALAALAIGLMLSLNGCTTERTIIIEDWTYQIPRAAVDKTAYWGWKGWI